MIPGVLPYVIWQMGSQRMGKPHRVGYKGVRRTKTHGNSLYSIFYFTQLIFTTMTGWIDSAPLFFFFFSMAYCPPLLIIIYNASVANYIKELDSFISFCFLCATFPFLFLAPKLFFVEYDGE